MLKNNKELKRRKIKCGNTVERQVYGGQCGGEIIRSAVGVKGSTRKVRVNVRVD